jgi:hypothetical protein
MGIARHWQEGVALGCNAFLLGGLAVAGLARRLEGMWLLTHTLCACVLTAADAAPEWMAGAQLECCAAAGLQHRASWSI